MIRRAFWRNAVLCFAVAAIAAAQAPTGSVAGVVQDSLGAAMANSAVKILSVSTGLVRTIATSATGDYGFPSIPVGQYEVSVEASGFQRMVRMASVEAGQTTTADFNLTVGDLRESVNVDAATPQMQYDSNMLGGVVSRAQIEGLPLNGRSFLELAKLEPDVQAPSRSNNNRSFVPVLGRRAAIQEQEAAEHGSRLMAAVSWR